MEKRVKVLFPKEAVVAAWGTLDTMVAIFVATAALCSRQLRIGVSNSFKNKFGWTGYPECRLLS